MFSRINHNGITYVSACEGNNQVFQFVQAVVDAGAPSFLHQWFHSLKEDTKSLGFILVSESRV